MGQAPTAPISRRTSLRSLPAHRAPEHLPRELLWLAIAVGVIEIDPIHRPDAAREQRDLIRRPAGRVKPDRAILDRPDRSAITLVLPPCLMSFPRPNGCWPTVDTMPTGFVTLYKRRGSLLAFRVGNPETRPSNTTSAATKGAIGLRSCSGGSRTGGVSLRATTDAQWLSSQPSLSPLPSSSGYDQ